MNVASSSPARCPLLGRLDEEAVSRASTLTDVIIRLADVIVPHGDIQGLFGQVTVFDIIKELLWTAEGEVSSSPLSFQCQQLGTEPKESLEQSILGIKNPSYPRPVIPFQ